MRNKDFFAILVIIIATIQGCATRSSSKQAPVLSTTEPNTPIPRSSPKDKAKYFLLEKKKEGDIVRALYQRVSGNSTSYTLMQMDCATRQMRELGHSEKSIAAMKEKPGKWFTIVPGSSNADIANFVCS